jgi:protein-L-isoaspartate(D-aspartate) O-methyltransferase
VPRERFLAADLGEFAYDDGPLPIGEGQTISQPYIVALMSEAARLGVEDRVLEVGAGSGYAAALLGELAREVHSVERHETLAKEAGRRLAELAPNVRVPPLAMGHSAGRKTLPTRRSWSRQAVGRRPTR